MIGSCYSASVLERKGVMESMLSWKANVCLTGAAAFQPWTLLLHESESENRLVKSLSSVPLRRRQWHPTPVLLPGKSHGRRSLEGWSPWGRWGSDTTERLHFHFSLSCIGEENGNPLQCSCLENPRDGGVWWAAVNWVTQSQTRLKRLGSSVPLFATPGTVACQAPLSLEFSRQEYWSGELFPSLFKGRWYPRFLGKISQF